MRTSKDEAFNEVNKLIKRYDSVNPYEIALKCKYNVIFMELPSSTLGQIVRSHRSCTIFIDERLEEPTKKFVLAHELGHCRLHKGYSTPFFNKFGTTINSKNEKQANEFAFALLLKGVDTESFNVYQLLNYLDLPYDFERFI